MFSFKKTFPKKVKKMIKYDLEGSLLIEKMWQIWYNTGVKS